MSEENEPIIPVEEMERAGKIIDMVKTGVNMICIGLYATQKFDQDHEFEIDDMGDVNQAELGEIRAIVAEKMDEILDEIKAAPESDSVSG